MYPSLLTSTLALLLALPIVAQAQTRKSDPDTFAINQRLGRGINLGNALDAPTEGEWGVKLEESYFQIIADAGFNSVRIPVRWSAHAAKEAPYTIDPAFMARVDWAVTQATARKLAVILNVHHYVEMDENPLPHVERLKAIWRQIAQHFADRPDTVVFEALNEPHGKFLPATWNTVLPQVLAVIRESNPKRVVIVGPAHWNHVSGLKDFQLPNDGKLIVTIHYYEPYHFTHQGAEWDPQAAAWMGTTWTNTPTQELALRTELDTAAKWGEDHGVPINMGEFGAYKKADMDSRVRWTRFVVSEAEKRGMSWAYWEFCAEFGAYDPEKHEWRKPLLGALLGDKK